jgi:hypothetical protein
VNTEVAGVNKTPSNRLSSQIPSDKTEKPGRDLDSKQIDRFKNTLSTRKIGKGSVIGGVSTHNYNVRTLDADS